MLRMPDNKLFANLIKTTKWHANVLKKAKAKAKVEAGF